MDARTRPRRHRQLLVASALVLCVLGPGAWWWLLSDAGVARRAHDEALSRWQSRAPSAYAFDFVSCGGMCAYCPIRVSVADGQVTAVEDLGDEGCGARALAGAPTIEDVFDLEERSRTASSTDSFAIDYDPVWGFPASGSFRCPDGWSDCGSGFAVSSFEVLPAG